MKALTGQLGDLPPGFQDSVELAVSVPITLPTEALVNDVSISSVPPDLTTLVSTDPDFSNNSAEAVTQVQAAPPTPTATLEPTRTPPPVARPVGGYGEPLSALELLLPWLALLSVVGVTSVGVVFFRRRAA